MITMLNNKHAVNATPSFEKKQHKTKQQKQFKTSNTFTHTHSNKHVSDLLMHGKRKFFL